MRALPNHLRRQLELAVLAGRRTAEAGVRAALRTLAVGEERKPDYLTAEQAHLRRGLRAKQRQLGGGLEVLAWECAYEQWHRLLFARFLAENRLLRHPQFEAPLSLEECEDIAEEMGEPDGWSVAARFAAEILPGIFRLDDPCVQLRLAAEHRVALERVLADLPVEVFLADDSLGWVYQYWQSERKDEVNSSEVKIGGADLGPVTQLFTENYMVRFLLENSLGAWWAARHRNSALVKDFEFLRFDDEGRPAAGSFDGWPGRVAEVTVIDPCCGSGHFLIEAFGMLWRMRAEEEGLDPVAAQDAVLRDNLFGLELDARCVQITIFAVALTAWKNGGGWRGLPVPNIASSGIPAKAPLEEWTELADGDDILKKALGRLHALFREADTLGSLIDPRRAAQLVEASGKQRSMWDVDFEAVAPLLLKAGGREREDPASAVLGADAVGIARAATLLARSYTLAATNVPYLGRGAQADVLRSACLTHWQIAEADLANVMVERFRTQVTTVAVVLPANWLFVKSFQALRELWLRFGWHSLARLGSGAFRSISGEVVQSVLWIAGDDHDADTYFELDASALPLLDKEAHLAQGTVLWGSRSRQRRNPGHVVQLATGGTQARPLGDFVDARAGISTGDTASFIRNFWEIPQLNDRWRPLQGAPDGDSMWSGRSWAVIWEGENGRLARWADSLKHLNHAAQKWRRGKPLWGLQGVAVRLMGEMKAAVYNGAMFDHNVGVIVPHSVDDVPALWAFASSGGLERAVRSFHTKLSIETGTLLTAQIDLDRWRMIAADDFPQGLPQPCTEDPTQWLFKGRPESSMEPLQVGVGRLVGYRWPGQSDSDDLEPIVDWDGIVCLPAVSGEMPAADRLTSLLSAAYPRQWSPAVLRRLLEQAGSKKKSLSDWLRDDFFAHHCKVFSNRPFVWHVWDGRKDGFSALVNYHRLNRAGLEKLTYTYLGDWIERQRADAAEDVAGADLRLAGARELKGKLEAILEGEPPYDVFVRWKELHEQPIGWDPDLDDGVRMNIRPFVKAGVLRSKVNVHWKKDRGRNPDGSERHTDLHYTRAAKLEARRRLLDR
jgi:hypothetical protein